MLHAGHASSATWTRSTWLTNFFCSLRSVSKQFHLLIMSSTSAEAARALFGDATSVADLVQRIRTNAHLWFDEHETLRLLIRCALDSRIQNKTSTFGTILLSRGGPFIMMFWVDPDSRVRWQEV